MQYDVNTPKEYIDALEDDWRRSTLEELRSLIKSKAPQLDEVISYKMLGYTDDQGLVFHLNAQRNHVGLYVGNAKKIDTEGRMLEGIDVGKGCIRFKKSLKVKDTQIDKFLEKAMIMRQQGMDFDC